MISGRYKVDSYKWHAFLSMFFRGVGICILGTSLGLSAFNISHFNIQTLITMIAGLLLLIFPIAPAGFLLAYLIGLPFLDSLIPFFTTDSSGLRFGPQILFRGGLIVLLTYYWLANLRNPLVFRPAIPMLLLLLLLVLSTLASGIRTQLGMITWVKHLYWMLLLLTVADMVAQGSMKLETIYRCVIISTLCFMAIVVAAPFIGIDLGSFYGIGDARGPYAPHSLALCLCFGFIVAMASCTTQKNKFLLLLLVLFCIAITISIARTYVRTGYLSFFTSLSIFVLFVWRYGGREASLHRYRMFLTLSLIIIICAFVVYCLTQPEALKKRTSDLSDVESAGSGRTMIYEAAMQRYLNFSMLEHVFGGGLGATHSLLGLKVPHNDYLVILLAGGPAGLILHFWLLLSLWRQIKSTARATYQPLIIAGCALTIFVVGTMTNPVIGYMSVMTCFGFLVGGAIGFYARADQMCTRRCTS